MSWEEAIVYHPIEGPDFVHDPSERLANHEHGRTGVYDKRAFEAAGPFQRLLPWLFIRG